MNENEIGKVVVGCEGIWLSRTRTMNRRRSCWKDSTVRVLDLSKRKASSDHSQHRRLNATTNRSCFLLAGDLLDSIVFAAL